VRPNNSQLQVEYVLDIVGIEEKDEKWLIVCLCFVFYVDMRGLIMTTSMLSRLFQITAAQQQRVKHVTGRTKMLKG